ncbi:MAG: helix-turn-helix domain-containing protein [Candidatus Woesearchaeota archaeon]
MDNKLSSVDSIKAKDNNKKQPKKPNNKCTDLNSLPLSLTVSDIAEILNISKQNAYKLCHSKDFPSVKIGKRIIVTKLAFIKWMEEPGQVEII